MRYMPTMTHHAQLRRHINDILAAYSAIYVTRAQNLSEGTADFTILFVRDDYDETCMGFRDDGFMDYVDAVKVQLDIDDELWVEIVNSSEINVFTYLWIAEGFVPERWPPWREDDMTVDPRLATEARARHTGT